VPRQIQEVLVEPWLREALIRLNPEIAAQPDRADEVLYKLRAIVLSVRSDGLIRANEEMTAWMRGERSMPFGPNNEHVPVRLIDWMTWRRTSTSSPSSSPTALAPPSAAPIWCCW
jgi:type I restriction enzyme R subunit